MKHLIIIGAVIISLFASCKKDIVYIPDYTSGDNSTSVNVGLKENDIVSLKLDGFPLVNLCSGEMWKALSGTVVVKLTTGRNLKVINVTGFAYQDSKGRVNQGQYSGGMELMWSNETSKAYKIILKPEETNSNLAIYALATLTSKGNDQYQILLDSGAIDCQ